MPNYVLNKITIKGSSDDLKKFATEQINAVEVNGEVLPFTFSGIVPMPQELNIESSNVLEKAVKYYDPSTDEIEKVKIKNEIEKMRLGKTFDEFVALGKQGYENLENYGATNWYDWRLENWGTKWDAFDVEEPIIEDDNIFLEFTTAWSAPREFFESMANKYKSLTFFVSYADEDLGVNCGELVYGDGELVSDEEGDRAFAAELWGYDDDEFDDDDDDFEDEED